MVEPAAMRPNEASNASDGAEPARRTLVRDIHGIVFGTMGKPTRVLVPGYSDPNPENFGAWLEGLRAEGWSVTLTPALSFEGVLVDARPTR